MVGKSRLQTRTTWVWLHPTLQFLRGRPTSGKCLQLSGPDFPVKCGWESDSPHRGVMRTMWVNAPRGQSTTLSTGAITACEALGPAADRERQCPTPGGFCSRANLPSFVNFPSLVHISILHLHCIACKILSHALSHTYGVSPYGVGQVSCKFHWGA